MIRRLSFKAQFGLIALISAVAIGVALASGALLLYEYESLVERIEEEDLQELQKWSAVVRDLAEAHDAFVWMVSNLRAETDEQKIYLEGKKHLAELDDLIASVSIAAVGDTQASAAANRNPAGLIMELATYRRAIVTSLEMLTVNPALADRYLARSAISINSVNRTLARALESRQKRIGESIRAKVAPTQRFWMQIMAGTAVLSVLLLVMIGRFTRALRETLDFIQASLAQLGRGNTAIDLSTTAGGAEYRAVVGSLARFREALIDRQFAQSQMRAIFDSILEAVIVIDERGQIVETNPVATRIFGYAPEEMRGKNVSMIVPPEHAAHHDGHLARYLETGEARIVGKVRFLQGLRRDGARVPIQLAVSEFKLGAATFFAGVITDITERIEAEKALREARDEALRASSAKADFLATMSHEIRTPMNGILGMAQLLDGGGLDAQQRAECTRILLGSSQTLITLLNDVLDLSKVEAGSLVLSPEPVSPARLIREACALFSEAAQAKGLLMELPDEPDPPCWVVADPVRLRQMLSNLVSNAIKFTSRGIVRVEFKEVSSGPESGMFEFAVIDTGAGIAPEDIERLFERYAQVGRPLVGAAAGTGLGLSLVRLFARNMGGDAGVSSVLGEGSRFWFRIRVPRASAPVNVPETGDATGADTSLDSLAQSIAGRKVLIAEDTPANRIFLVMALSRIGVVTQEAENGVEAFEAIASGGRFDCIFMDMRMPGFDGDEATRRIRAWEAEHGMARTPIIAVTANAYDEDRRQCKDAGMDDFLAKPVRVHDLKALLARWLPHPGTGERRAPH